MIYLDYAATAPIRGEVIERMGDVMKQVGNPSSVHQAGRSVRAIAETGRRQIAELIGARARDIVITAGGTEANNTVINASHFKSLIVSEIEHDCVLSPARSDGRPLFMLRVGPDGRVDLDHLKELLKEAPAPALVSVMLANNETGVIQPVREVCEIAKAAGAFVHTDAAQAAGKIVVSMAELGVDYLTLSSHKLGGPQGVGAIALSPTAPLDAFVKGGGQELGRRSGTENIAGIAGFGLGCELAKAEMEEWGKVQALRDELETKIKALNPDIEIVGGNVARLPGTSCLILPGVKGETQVMHIDLAGICVSSGSACSSGKVAQSHVLAAMGYEKKHAECSIRVSMGCATKTTDIEAFLKAYTALVSRVGTAHTC